MARVWAAPAEVGNPAPVACFRSAGVGSFGNRRHGYEEVPEVTTRTGRYRRAARVALAAAVAVLAAACTAAGGRGGDGSGSAGRAKIALLLPERAAARYEAHDRPLFEAKVKALCPGCQVVYANAGQDANRQTAQAGAALGGGAKVMVLDPVDSSAAAAIVAEAKRRDVPVISYDRMVTGADVDYYISFDNEQVGRLQGESLVNKLKADGRSGGIVMINGSPADNNARQYKRGAHSVIDASGFKVVREYDTPRWTAGEAEAQMGEAIAALGRDGFVGVYAANDVTASGAIAAMKRHRIDPLPPVTGQDAELAAVQRVITGEQYMTVYKAIRSEAEQAAELAVHLASGDRTAADALARERVGNGRRDVPSIILSPIVVTKQDALQTISQMVADGYLKGSQVCTGRVAAACQRAGLT
jgi:D-xylose transport system substrate-binding protein